MTDRNIKVTLTLEDGGFSLKAQKATETVELLKRAFDSNASSSRNFENQFKGLTTGLSALTKEMSGIKGSLEGVVSKLSGVALKLEQAGNTARSAGRGLSDVSRATKTMNSGLSDSQRLISDVRAAMSALKPSLAQTAQSQEALGNSAKNASKKVKDAAAEYESAKARELAAEISTNDKIIANKEAAIRDMLRMENDLRNQALAARVEGDRIRATKKRGAGAAAREFYSDADRIDSNVGLISQQRGQLTADIAGLRQKGEEIKKNIALAEQEAAANKRYAQEAIAETRAKAAADKQADAERKQAEKEAREAARQAREEEKVAARERRENERRLRQEMQERARLMKQMAREEQENLRQNAQLIAALGQAYAAAQIDSFFMKAVDSASKLQLAQNVLQGYNLSSEKMAVAGQVIENLVKTLPVTITEATKGVTAAIGGLAKFDSNIISETLPMAMKGAYGIQQVLKVVGQDVKVDDVVKNIYGLVELRQQQYDAEAIKRTTDLVFKAVAGTSGKVTVQDIETVIRRLGPAASVISDEAIMALLPIIDQVKVAGGGSGGGATVSTVGTAVKMMQAYAAGKQFSNRGAEIMLGAGLINMDAVSADPKSSPALFKKQVKTAGMVGADLAEVNPTLFIKDIVAPKLFEFMKLPENAKKYFGDKNPDDITAKVSAFNRLFREMGFSITAVDFFAKNADPRMQQRSEDQTQLLDKYDGVDAFMKKRLSNDISTGITSLKTSFENLAATLGVTVAPAIVAISQGLKGFIDAATNFFANNPIAGAATVGALAVSGLSLAIRGAVGVLGLFGSPLQIFSKLAGVLTSTRVAATGVGAGFAQGAQTAQASSGIFGGIVSKITGDLNAIKDSAATAALKTKVAALDMSGTVLAQTPKLGVFGQIMAATMSAASTAFNAFGGVARVATASTVGGLGNLSRATGGAVGSFAARFPLISAIATGVARTTTGAMGAIGAGAGTVATRVSAAAAITGSGFKLIGTAAMGAARVVGGAFLRMIPYVGVLLMAWDFAGIIGNFEIFGTSIKNHALVLYEYLKALAEKSGNALKSMVPANGYTSEQADADNKAIDERFESRKKAIIDGYAAEKKASAEAKAKSDKAMKDAEKMMEGLNKPTVPGASATGGIFDPPKERTPRQFEDPFVNALGRFDQDIQMFNLEVAALLDRGAEDLEKKAQYAYARKVLGGEFDVGNDPRSRSRLFNDKNVDYKKANFKDIDMGNAEAQKWQQQYIAIEKLKDEKEALEKTNQRLAASEADLANALEALDGDSIRKKSEGLRALEREFAKIDEAARNLDRNSEEFKTKESRKNNALANRSSADLLEFARKSKENRIAEEGQNDPTLSARERATKAAQAELDIYKQNYQDLVQVSKDFQDRAIAATAEGSAERKALEDRYRKANTESHEEYVKRIIQLERKIVEAKKTEGQKMLDEWRLINVKMEKASAQWLDRFANGISDALTGGKMDFRQFAIDIGKEIVNMNVKNMIAQSGLGDIFLQGAGAITGALVPSLGAKPAAPAGNAIAEGIGAGAGAGLGSLADGLTEKLNAMGSAAVGTTVAQEGLTVATGLNQAATASNTAATSVNTGAAVGNTVATGGETASKTVNATVTGVEAGAKTGNTVATTLNSTATGANTLATIAGTAAEWANTIATKAAAAAKAIASAFGFANGGIMTSGGPIALAGAAFANGGVMTEYGTLPLQKYANGGIAKKPQVAIYGEGKMPEAYVPLPDGRTIPVTMSGAAQGGGDVNTVASSVQIVINVDKSGGSSEEVNGNAENSQMKSLANKIKALVKDELATQQRPGGMLYNPYGK